jgi:hypothetical protein
MKKTLIVTIALSVISFVFMIFYFLASTDIYHDYVSKIDVSRGIISNVEEIPEWTNCKGEWQILEIDFIVRIIFMILIIAVLIKLINNYNKQSLHI